MRLLVTRPDEDASALLPALEAMGHRAIASPLLAIHFLPDVVLPQGDWQALLVTSANGVRALAQHPDVARLRVVPVCAVGEASAAAARAAGFEHVRAATGDVEALSALVGRELKSDGGPLLHVAGSVVAGDLKGALEAEGFRVERAVLYEAKVADYLPEAARAALVAEAVDGVLLYSPRTAATFAALIEAEGLEGHLKGVRAYCLSAAVAAALGRLAFAAVEIAETPAQAALLALLGEGK
jgi:uroporphyrinogen-III synthase